MYLSKRAKLLFFLHTRKFCSTFAHRCSVLIHPIGLIRPIGLSYKKTATTRQRDGNETATRLVPPAMLSLSLGE